MYCKYCGKETQNDNGICDNCNSNNTKQAESGENKGIIALVFGIAGIVFCNLVFSIVGYCIGKKTKGTEGESYGEIGRITGLIGIIFNSISLAMSLLVIILIIAFPALLIAFAGNSIMTDLVSTMSMLIG